MEQGGAMYGHGRPDTKGSKSLIINLEPMSETLDSIHEERFLDAMEHIKHVILQGGLAGKAVLTGKGDTIGIRVTWEIQDRRPTMRPNQPTPRSFHEKMMDEIEGGT